MTIHELSNQLYNLSVAGYFNGERFTRRQLQNHIAGAFRGPLKAGNRYVIEIALPDGRWLFTVNRLANTGDGVDYTIPDTREVEAKIKALLITPV
jgi:hypothetical protein